MEAWKNCQKLVHRFELINQLPTIKDIEWIRDAPAVSLQNAIERLDISFNRFFYGGGFPKWATKKKYNSIVFKEQIGVRNNTIRIPKVGFLKIVKDAPINGRIKRIIVKKEITGYFACIVCDKVNKSIQNIDENQVVGIDMGITRFLSNSNGDFILNPKHFKKYERQLRIENRSLSRKKKGSNSWAKQCKRLALLHHKISNVRKDFLHKASTMLAKKFHIVYMEDLNISGMAQNRNLSKYVLDCGWRTFIRMLEYKTTIVKVNPKHTSQTCSKCGSVDAKSRISQCKFICTTCGHSENADVNAARNILSKGVALSRKREALACA